MPDTAAVATTIVVPGFSFTESLSDLRRELSESELESDDWRRVLTRAVDDAFGEPRINVPTPLMPAVADEGVKVANATFPSGPRSNSPFWLLPIACKNEVSAMMYETALQNQ